jgi:hypothetical protein
MLRNCRSWLFSRALSSMHTPGCLTGTRKIWGGKGTACLDCVLSFYSHIGACDMILDPKAILLMSLTGDDPDHDDDG